MAKAIMIQGTASGVGKTMLTLALCRIFKQDGYKVSPFKAQNMTSNTCFTEDGVEIAVSQWLQAKAAGLTPDADMNPILLKPLKNKNGSQLLVRGKSFNNTTVVDTYDFKNIKQKLKPEIAKAYSLLCDKSDIMVIEGAGSPVELNLNQDDIVNMGMAKLAKAPVILVSDIDRGGIFASLYGTLQLFNESERPYVKAVLINRFKGKTSFFTEGLKIIEEITNLPIAGVVPAIEIDLPEEDSLYKGREFDNSEFESQIDSVADSFRKSLNMELIYKILNEGAD